MDNIKQKNSGNKDLKVKLENFPHCGAFGVKVIFAEQK